MSNLLKAEFYKLFHSWYFWGIGLFNLLLSSVLLLDSVGETSNLFFASIYNMPILYFLTIIFSALFVGNDFGRRTLQSYINAGHRRGKILFAKLVVHQIACMVILSFPLLLHSIIGTFVTILRFAKYKGPEISGIEAHNERTKEKYASNPDIDPSRTHLNFHLIKPERKYRAESECQIAEAGCRTRSDSVRVVEALITATPEFFKGKKRAEIREFFNEALEFIKQNQAPETIISAVVHLDEKSPHMHLCFVPLTEDKRLCAKEILGNKKKLTQWQDKYWEHMVKKYPDLERGESASETGRDHIPTRVFKQMARLNKQHDKLAELLSDMKFTNYKERSAQIAAFLEKYIPDVAAMETQMKKYKKFFKTADGKQKALEKKNDELTAALEKSEKESTVKKLQEMRLHSDYERIKGILDRIPPEIIRAYTHRDSKTQEVRHYR